ncbi:IS110 family transposase [Deinococcus saxicola]|uniref:IS110 family transposase n=1 Tax=Deinococcus saxicola TaxID=249406 RepID=UPI0039F10F4A
MFVLGLDVGLSDLYARLLNVPVQGPPVALGDVCVFPNSPAGHQALCAWLQTYSAVPALTTVVMESTGVYWERIAVCLHTAGFAVSVVNAAQIKYFAKSLLRRGKTDKMDAELIARYGATMRPARWTPTDACLESLRALVHERDAVIELITLEKGRHHALDHRHAVQDVVVRLCDERLALLFQQRDQLNTAIQDAIALPGRLHVQIVLLTSVPGIGQLTAAVLLSETGHLEEMHCSEQWTAYAGLSPVPRQSGAMVGRSRISKIGNARLRRAMYMSAVTASRLSNPLGAYYRRLVEQGKPKKVALIALARKILRVCFAVLKTAQPFDPAYQRPLKAA